MLAASLIAQLREVVFERTSNHAGQGHARDQRRGPGDGDHQGAPAQQRARESGERSGGRRAADGASRRPAIAQEDQHGAEAVGGRPAEDHADTAHLPELPESPEAREGEAAVGDTGGQGRRQRRSGGGGQGDGHGLVDRASGRRVQLLAVASQQDDAEVDAVAEDDRAEERRVGVEVADGHRGDAKGERHAEQRGEEDIGQGEDAPVVDDDDQQDQHRAHQRDELDVRLERVVLLDRAGDVSRDLDGDVAEGRGSRVVDDAADVVADPKTREIAGPRGPRPRDDRQHRPVLALVVPAGKLDRALLALLQLVAKEGEVPGRVVVLLGAVRVGEGDEGRILPRHQQLLQVVVDALEVDKVGIEHLVALEEGLRRVGTVVDRAQIGAQQRLQPLDHRLGESFIGERIGALNGDDQRRGRAHAVPNPLQQRDLGVVLRQQLGKVGPQLQARGRHDRRDEHQQRADRELDVVPLQESDVAAHQRVGPGRSRGDRRHRAPL